MKALKYSFIKLIRNKSYALQDKSDRSPDSASNLQIEDYDNDDCVESNKNM